ncbi:MAG: hypothetical protein JSW63_09975 [Ignavibacterium sp.]|nr:MAG: hypothetical protein JSW63_09975 [Ignavibacterium sp.]
MQNPNSELRDYLIKLIVRLLYIKGLNKQLKFLKEWETPKRIIALEIGAYFFRLVGFSFNRTLLIELCMLLDAREEKCIIDWLAKAKEHSKSLEPSIFNPEIQKREILNTDAYKKIISEQQETITSKKEIIDRVKGRRDTALAHSDASYFNKPDDLYVKFPLSTEEIDGLINMATEILRMQHVYLFESDLDIQVHATSNIDTVLWHTRGFKRVWHDKRAKSLYPGWYKLDDFEEKINEYLDRKTK